MIYFYSFIAGLVSFISPCIIPMLTFYFNIITSLSLKQLMNEEKTSEVKKLIIKNTLLFIAGFTLIFTIAGSAAALVSKILLNNVSVLNIIGGIFIILFGLGMVIPRALACKIGRTERWLEKIRFKDNSLLAFLAGVFFAIACSHCIGPIVYSLLIYLGTSGGSVNGTLAMLLFSIGLGIPYLFAGLFLKKFIKVLKRMNRYYHVISKIFGLIIILFGILLLTNKFTVLVGFLYKILPIFKLPFGM